MKREPETTDEEWAEQLEARKARAARNMKIQDYKKGFITIAELQGAAHFWGCSEHEAEQRLMRGELPE